MWFGAFWGLEKSRSFALAVTWAFGATCLSCSIPDPGTCPNSIGNSLTCRNTDPTQPKVMNKETSSEFLDVNKVTVIVFESSISAPNIPKTRHLLYRNGTLTVNRSGFPTVMPVDPVGNEEGNNTESNVPGIPFTKSEQDKGLADQIFKLLEGKVRAVEYSSDNCYKDGGNVGLQNLVWMEDDSGNRLFWRNRDCLDAESQDTFRLFDALLVDLEYRLRSPFLISLEGEWPDLPEGKKRIYVREDNQFSNKSAQWFQIPTESGITYAALREKLLSAPVLDKPVYPTGNKRCSDPDQGYHELPTIRLEFNSEKKLEFGESIFNYNKIETRDWQISCTEIFDEKTKEILKETELKMNSLN